jgi:hypothetical protein
LVENFLEKISNHPEPTLKHKLADVEAQAVSFLLVLQAQHAPPFLPGLEGCGGVQRSKDIIASSSLRFLILSALRGFVRMSARFWCVGTYLTLMKP